MNLPGLHAPQYPSDPPPHPLRCAPLGHGMLLQSTHCAWPVTFWNEPDAQSEQLPAPTPALNLPTLHVRHTPALAPPQPLRATPADEHPPHGRHTAAPAVMLYVSAAHASQCAATLVRGSGSLALPREPAAHASQLVEPPPPWCLPNGHSKQLCWLLEALKYPLVHAVQLRSAVVVGADTACLPGAQSVCLAHEACPASGWKNPAWQASQAPALTLLENVPAAHAAHVRSISVFGVSTMCCPATQTVCGRQKPRPGWGW